MSHETGVQLPARRTAVLLLGSASTAGLGTLAPTIREHGLDVAVLTSPDPSPAVLRFAATADRWATVANPYDARLVASAATAIADGPPAALLSWHDGAIATAAHAAELLGIQGVSWRALARARNKYAARRALRAAGLPTPPFATISGPAEAPRVAAAVGFPAIVKPLSGTASSLVRRVTTVAELAGVYTELAERLPRLLGDMYLHPVADPDAAEPLDQTATFLVEGLLRGPEFCADVVVRDGVVEHVLLLENFLLDEHFFGRGFALPPLRLPPAREPLVWAAIDEAIAALGIDNTLVHIEVIDDVELGPTIVEVNAGRGGGLLVGLLANASTGVDLREEYLALALGEPAPQRRPARMPPPLANLAFYPPGGGRVAAIDGLDDVAKHPDVVTVRPPEIAEVTSGDYEASPLNVIVFGLPTRDELVAVYEELAGLVRWQVEPAGAAGRRDA